MNVTVLKGNLAGSPETRSLPTGRELAMIQLVTHVGTGTFSVPVAVWDPPAWLIALDGGVELLVIGSVRRRFYRVGTTTASRVEVESSFVCRADDDRRMVKGAAAFASALGDTWPGVGDVRNANALNQIHAAMSGVDWDADTLEEIGRVVESTGRKIAGPPHEHVALSTYSKTVYVEVEAEDEDAAEAIVAETVESIRHSRVTNFDLDGPIEDVTDRDGETDEEEDDDDAPAYGTQTTCATCRMDIEYHGPEDGWIGRGGDAHCDESGGAPRDGDGMLIALPHALHSPATREQLLIASMNARYDNPANRALDAAEDVCSECGADITPHDGGEFGLHDYGCSRGPWPNGRSDDPDAEPFDASSTEADPMAAQARGE